MTAARTLDVESEPTSGTACTAAVRAFEVHGFHVLEFDPEGARNASGEPAMGVDAFLVFSHATGIAAGTYTDLLSRWAMLWNVRIYAYDARGMGKTKVPAPPAGPLAPKPRVPGAAFTHRGGDVAALLTADLCKLFWELKARETERAAASSRKAPEAVLAGHSFGGWLSLFAAEACHVERLVLLDMSILPPKTATLWALACAFRQRKLHTLAVAARHRKRRYRSAEEAHRVFRRVPFFRGWGRKRIQAYVDANYMPEEAGNAALESPLGLVLRHDPTWEARIYEAQQPSHMLAFLSVPAAIRARLNIVHVAGAQSIACDPNAGPLFRSLFPRARWCVLPEGDHMFPFSREESFLNLLAELKTDQQKMPPGHEPPSKP